MSEPPTQDITGVKQPPLPQTTLISTKKVNVANGNGEADVIDNDLENTENTTLDKSIVDSLLNSTLCDTPPNEGQGK